MAEVLEKKKRAAKKAPAKSKAKYSKKQYLDWFTIMYRIRTFEEKTL